MIKNEKKIKSTKTIDGENFLIYHNDLMKYKPLGKEEEKVLIKQYRENNDLVARQKLITSNLRYAFSLVNKYKGMGVPVADLLEEANCGLIESVDGFNEKYDVKVITYAKWNMEYKMQRAISIEKKIPESDLPEEKDEQLSDEASLNDVYSYNDYTNEAFITEDEDFERMNAAKDVESIISILDERERDFIKMYYGIQPYDKEHTYQEIGKKYNLTKERVRQIIDKIMRKLRVQALKILK